MITNIVLKNTSIKMIGLRIVKRSDEYYMIQSFCKSKLKQWYPYRYYSIEYQAEKALIVLLNSYIEYLRYILLDNTTYYINQRAVSYDDI